MADSFDYIFGASINNIRISIIVMVMVTAVCTGIAAKCFKWE